MTPAIEHRLIRAILATLISALVLIAAWLPNSKITIAAFLLKYTVLGLLLPGGIWACSAVFLMRVGRTPAFNRAWLVATFSRLKRLAAAKILLVALATVLIIFSYLGTALDWPLADAVLARGDAALGFDWVKATYWINQHEFLARTFSLAYYSLVNQMFVLPIFLAVFARAERVYEFVALFGASGIATCAIMIFVPAAGPVDFYHPPPEIRAALGHAGGYLPTFHALRDLPAFTMDRVEGLTTFPSFHAALGAILIYASRGRWFFHLPMTVLNVFLIAGAISEGGHYLVDVVAGLIVAAAAIAAIRALCWPWSIHRFIPFRESA